ncbi:hypothetical protein [Rhizobium sp. MHM7A]|uniref:hypothetical protein n=1 Tax=Rhizobium sp. MHM7A TaxID=2583233 RepID=UPI0011065443|nr:hypothetical protein [Rhizobium sp. MHM7A]TLX16374.1 hypothetical protein FFR93_03310 [Rhizobium sp. MHM7A]
MSIKSHTDLVVLDTIVHLIKAVPRHLNRDQLERIASDNSAQSEIPLWAGASEHFNMLAWEAKVHLLAAQGRFPRPDDKAPAAMVEQIIEQIRDMQAGKQIGYPFPGDIAMREGVQLSLARNGFDLHTLPLPPTLHELIDRGEERPDHVSQERWDRAIASYNHAMTIENSPGAVDPEDYEPYEFEWTEEHERQSKEWLAESGPDAAEEDATYRM